VSYVGRSEEERAAMLAAVGASKFEDLLDDVPDGLRVHGPLDVPPAASELELRAEIGALAAKNDAAHDVPSFLGAGMYDHYIPSALPRVALRSEFMTAYTPYQPEVAQGTLQVIFEFQSMIAELTGMDVANASLYDGASAVVEAGYLARNHTGRKGIVLAGALHPHYEQALRTFLGTEHVERGLKGLGKDTACVIAQYPNFFGGLDDLAALAKQAHDAGALFVVAADPIALAILTPPGALGADVCVGEAQSLGAPISLGGPVCGFFAGKKEFVRRFPGRIVGETVDGHGRRGFVLTLQTREQHIRREKATSNICTNQGLIALMNTIYLSLLGKEGLVEVATLCFQKTHYAHARAARPRHQASVRRSVRPRSRVEAPGARRAGDREGPRARRAARRRRRDLFGRHARRAAGRRDREAHEGRDRPLGRRARGVRAMSHGTETPSVQSGAAQARPAEGAPPPAGALAGLPPPAAPVLSPVPQGVVEPLLSELSVPGHRGVRLPACDVPTVALSEALPAWAIRQAKAELPEMSEPEVIRHFTRLSTLNHHLDKGIYPLGSCTMKHNPKINDELAFLPGMANAHPLAPAESIQGALEIVHRLEGMLARITGFDAVTLMPAAGAQGEFTGMLLARAYYQSIGQTNRTKVLVPDSAHGTNPASVHAVGWSVVELKSKDGHLDLEVLKAALGPDVAAVMVTQPSTLGMFEPQIQEAADLIHAAGAQLYLDGANFNALVGLGAAGQGVRPDAPQSAQDVLDPHGGGGPGAGPVAVLAHLEPFLPGPRVREKAGMFTLEPTRKESVGRVHSFLGNFGVLVRAYCYIRSLGPDGLAEISREAILNANYLMRKLAGAYDLPFDRPCMHEFVLSGKNLRKHGVRTTDVAKRLLDFGVHAPTVYFPLIVEEAIMIEPTETETLRTLDLFADVMLRIAREAREEPAIVTGAPWTTPVSRLDEGRAARELKLTWKASAKT